MSIVHQSQRMFKCVVCKKGLASTQSLQKHLKTHELTQDCFPCQTCGKMFTPEEAKSHHVKNIHSLKSESCPVCAKSFSSVGKVNAHIKTVHEETIYNCHECEYQSKSQGSLN